MTGDDVLYPCSGAIEVGQRVAAHRPVLVDRGEGEDGWRVEVAEEDQLSDGEGGDSRRFVLGRESEQAASGEKEVNGSMPGHHFRRNLARCTL